VEIEYIKTDKVHSYIGNAKSHPTEQVEKIAGSIDRYGFRVPILIDGKNEIIAGHGRLQAALMLNLEEVPCVRCDDLSEAEVKAFRLADNRVAESDWEDDLLASEFLELLDLDVDLPDFTGFDQAEIDRLLNMDIENPYIEPERDKLSELFIIPPFSVLNARSGEWQDRKSQWLSLGIESQLGRAGEDGKGGKGTAFSQTTQSPEMWNKKNRYEAEIGRTVSFDEFFEAFPEEREAGFNATSVFDPVLCELAYRWFCKSRGVVLDPFAGGSVRGIVAAKLGLEYIGCDLSEKQVVENRKQWNELPDAGGINTALSDFKDDNLMELTPVEQHGSLFFKRDDYFRVGGSCGGKVRTCLALAEGAKGLVTAGSRSSPQVNIVAQIARKLGIPCHAHTPQGELLPEVLMAGSAGAEIIQHKAGYNSVIIARAREDAEKTGYTEIPFGMECQIAVIETSSQVANIPDDTKRIIMPVGSGMSLAGVLAGLKEYGKDIPVLGVRVGADPTERLDKYAPDEWRDMVTIVEAGMDYDTPAPVTELNGINLDPIYEAKCIPFVEDGDLFWIVGIRASEVAEKEKTIDPTWHCTDSRKIDDVCAGVEADLVFTCPPYADLEVYSDDPNDISNMSYDDFKDAYFEIIKKSCSLLKEDSFAVIVVGEVRDKAGNYYNFVGDTITAFLEAGMEYYNEAILVTPLGSVMLRTKKPFNNSRKLGKTHQNVLVFVKGDAKAAAARCGEVVVRMPEIDE